MNTNEQMAERDESQVTIAEKIGHEALITREGNLRRIARRNGLKLMKSRRRNPQAGDFGCFMLIHAERNYVVAGAERGRHSLSLDGVEQVLAEYASNE